MVKVAHNDTFRSLLNMPRYTSASTLFVMKNMDKLDDDDEKEYVFLGKKNDEKCKFYRQGYSE